MEGSESIFSVKKLWKKRIIRRNVITVSNFELCSVFFLFPRHVSRKRWVPASFRHKQYYYYYYWEFWEKPQNQALRARLWLRRNTDQKQNDDRGWAFWELSEGKETSAPGFCRLLSAAVTYNKRAPLDADIPILYWIV